MNQYTCLHCKYFRNDPKFLEEFYHGLNTLSSAWGCVRGDAGVCIKHGVYLFPRGKCSDFLCTRENKNIDNQISGTYNVYSIS
ncbi:hypothetical protein JCM13304A_03460 [Desulfothermus okinawensis JCM 13304]